MANTATSGKNSNVVSAPNKYALNERRAQRFKHTRYVNFAVFSSLRNFENALPSPVNCS